MPLPQSCLLWFRQDLRLTDNPALVAAAAKGSILPIYIYDTAHPKQWQMGAASRWWLHHSLTALDQSIEGHLRIFMGDPLKIIPELLNQTGIRSIVWNRCYEPWQIQRDTQLKKQLLEDEIEVESFNGTLLWEPWKIHKEDGSPYKVFTPYYRRGCLNAPEPRRPSKAPQKMKWMHPRLNDTCLSDLALMPTINWYEQIAAQWQPGEAGAQEHLSRFIDDNIQNYKQGRDYPNLKSTSRLSPHLHFGEISPNTVWHRARQAFNSNIRNANLDCFLSELGWREFSYYQLFHFPDLPEKNFQEKFDRFPWGKDTAALKAWQKGQTGVPIVDAGMRELWQTGYMHNRVRMIVGSFLVKNLLQHWSQGEQWFWDCLVDADLASNSASWQWVAGSGADAAPYFRIFNPVTQGQKFDANGAYVRQYCPELSEVPDKFIHCPWEASPNVLQQAGLELGVDYPKPIVDLKASRQRALIAFSQIKS